MMVLVVLMLLFPVEGVTHPLLLYPSDHDDLVHITTTVGEKINSSFISSPGFEIVAWSETGAIPNTSTGLITWTSENPGKYKINIHVKDVRNLTLKCGPFTSLVNIKVKKNTTTGSCKNTPTLKNPINYIQLTIGDVYHHVVDPETFYDAEDGNTRQLSLNLRTGYGDHLPDNHWMQLDSTGQVIYGLVLPDINEESDNLQLMAEDSCGNVVSDGITVDIKPHGPLSPFLYTFKFSEHSFCILLDLRYLYIFVQRLQLWFKDGRLVSVVKKDSENCSITVTFSNSSHATENCSQENLSIESMNIFTELGELRSDFLCHFLPAIDIFRVELQLQKNCSANTDKNVLPVKFRSDLNHWLSIVLPIIIIIFILVVIILIVYFIFMKRRKQYVLKQEKPIFEERYPVIFKTETSIPDPVLKPRTPIIISSVDENKALDTELGDTRSMPSSPSYNSPSTQPPPFYRLPPPYAGDHQYW